MKAMRSFSEKVTKQFSALIRVFYIEVVVRQLTQPFIRTENDIGNDGTIQYLAVTSWNISYLLNPGLW